MQSVNLHTSMLHNETMHYRPRVVKRNGQSSQKVLLVKVPSVGVLPHFSPGGYDKKLIDALSDTFKTKRKLRYCKQLVPKSPLSCPKSPSSYICMFLPALSLYCACLLVNGMSPFLVKPCQSRACESSAWPTLGCLC